MVYVLEWVLYDFVPDQWTFLLGSKTILCALVLTALLIYTDKLTLFIRSIIAWLVIDAWCNVVEFAVWQWSNETLNSTWFAALVFFLWLLFVVKRKYHRKIDLVNLENINLLILKPRNHFEVIKGLIGYPCASICIASNNYVWSFRKRSGVFERIPYSPDVLKNHMVIDTKIKATDDVIDSLNSIVGTKRFPCVKCIFTIRHVLNKIGGKYRIKTWFDYIPGVYFMRVI